MKKKGISILLCLAMFFTVLSNPMITRATGEISNTPNTSYTKAYVDNFKLSGTYPVKDGYVFAGWYKDEECTEPVTNTIPDVAYPKFVDEQVLTMKGQLPANITSADTTTSLRLITAVDSTKYKEIGFKLQKGTYEGDFRSSTVYETLYGYKNSEQINYTPKDTFGSSAAYFATKIITKIPKADFDTPFTVTPYWVTLDGTTVTGTARTWTINGAMPVNLTVDINEVNNSDKKVTDYNLSIKVSEQLSTELIINGDDANAKAISVEKPDWDTDNYWAWVYLTDIINELKIGENTLTVRVKRDGNVVSEKTVTYVNTGFLYVVEQPGNSGEGTQDVRHSMEIVELDGEKVLKFTENNASATVWNGVRSAYIFMDGYYNGPYVTKGITYITMDVKLETASGLYASYNSPKQNTSIWRKPLLNESSDIIDEKGVQGTVETDKWMTVKIPLTATETFNVGDKDTGNFYVKPQGNNGVMYIRNVRYCTDEYVAPLADLTLDLEKQASVDWIKITSNAVNNDGRTATIIANGDESTAKTQVLDGNWFDISRMINDLKLGDNELTVRVPNGTSYAEKTITYTNTAYMYKYNDNQTLDLVDDPETGEKVLKFTETGTQQWSGVRSKYITCYYKDENNIWRYQKNGRFAGDDVTYITMEVKVTKGTGIYVSYVDDFNDNDQSGYKIWKSVDFGTASDVFVNGGVKSAANLNEWVTVKVPLKTNKITQGSDDCSRDFYVKPKGTDVEMYVRNVQYCKDEYVAPIEKLSVSVKKQGARDWLAIETSATGTAQIIANGDETNLKEHAISNGWFELTSMLNQMKMGTNKLTVRVPNGASTAQVTVDYENTGYLYAGLKDALSKKLEIAEDGGETVLKYNVDTTNKWDGIHSRYVQLQAGDPNGEYTPGLFQRDGIKFITMKVKLQDATALYLRFDAANVDKEINVGTTSEYLNGNTLNLNEWVDVKIPVESAFSKEWVNFYVTARWTDGQQPTLYIKDVQYLTDDGAVETSPHFQ